MKCKKTMFYLFAAGLLLSSCAECKITSDCSSTELCVSGSCTPGSESGNIVPDNNGSGSPVIPVGDFEPADTDSGIASDTDVSDTSGDKVQLAPDPNSLFDTEQFSNCVDSTVLIENEDELSDFFTVECVTGTVSITTSFVVNLDLPNLKYVGKSLIIQSNMSLLAVDGLSGLEYVGGNLSVENNPLLADVNGIKNLKFIGGHLLLRKNLTFNDLSGFKSITTIAGALSLAGLNSLTSVKGFNKLFQVGGGIEIAGDEYLNSLSGFPALKTLGGTLYAYSNSELPDCEVCGFLEMLQNGPDKIFVDKNLSDNCTASIEQCVNN
jgi:hypothetical protein